MRPNPLLLPCAIIALGAAPQRGAHACMGFAIDGEIRVRCSPDGGKALGSCTVQWVQPGECAGGGAIEESTTGAGGAAVTTTTDRTDAGEHGTTTTALEAETTTTRSETVSTSAVEITTQYGEVTTESAKVTTETQEEGITTTQEKMTTEDVEEMASATTQKAVTDSSSTRATGATTPSATVNDCENGWTSVAGTQVWYSHVAPCRRWHTHWDARSACRKRGGRLFVPRSAAQFAEVMSATWRGTIAWFGLYVDAADGGVSPRWDDDTGGYMDFENLPWRNRRTMQRYLRPAAKCAGYMNRGLKAAVWRSCASRRFFVCEKA